MRDALIVALGGAVGSVARWLVGQALGGAVRALPWGTLAVNLAGSAGAGVVAGVRPGGLLTALLAVGFLGAFTTASTLVAELSEQARSSVRAAAALLALHVGPGLLLAGAGLALGRALG